MSLLRSLSARILIGFAALVVTFGVITASLIRNTSEVEDEVSLIGNGYIKASLIAKNLQRRQEEIRTYLDQSLPDERNAQSAQNRLTAHLTDRISTIDNIRKAMDEVDYLSTLDEKQYRDISTALTEVRDAVTKIGPLYSVLLAHPPIGARTVELDATGKAAFETLDKLKVAESQVGTLTSSLASLLERRTLGTMKNLEQNEHTLRLRTIYLGITAIALGLLVTIWVVITLRPLVRLQHGARRVAAGDYASRIDEAGPAEVAELARELNRMARAIEERERELVRSERLAAVGKMAAMITHEVRNPLSSIGLNTELLEDELDANATEARSLCRSITREVDRLTAITEEYLAFARLPKPKVAPEAINVMVGALGAFVREDLAAKKVKLALDLDKGEPTALVDAAQIRQCLINLVRNAADAVVAKGGGSVTLRTRRTGARVAIEVVDDGTGIPADVLPRLFDPFFSTKEGGSGLGLALTQQIVKDHGGDLEVASVVGRGTTFTLTVPTDGA